MDIKNVSRGGKRKRTHESESDIDIKKKNFKKIRNYGIEIEVSFVSKGEKEEKSSIRTYNICYK